MQTGASPRMTLSHVGLLNPLHGSQRVKYWLALPAFLFIIAGIIYPTSYLLYNSLTAWSLTRLDLGQNFIGLDNYGKLLADARFLFLAGHHRDIHNRHDIDSDGPGCEPGAAAESQYPGRRPGADALADPLAGGAFHQWLQFPFHDGAQYWRHRPSSWITSVSTPSLKTSILGSPKTALAAP